ncbi:MAG: hypothetical protein EOO39_49175, partial [Cytophagaceae bacterium]
MLTVDVDLVNSVQGGMAIAFGLFAPIDRGDLPTSYGEAGHRLQFSNNNPCNFNPPYPSLVQDTRLRLGALPGDPDLNEQADDNTAGIDEDALTSFPFYDGSGTYRITIPVFNGTVNPFHTTAWMDMNDNGLFDNNEWVRVMPLINATSVTFTWTGVPPVLATGTDRSTAFRFRIGSNAQELISATGIASDGEVEDYLVRITNQVECNTWLSLPAQQNYVSIGDLDISGTQLTVEALVNRTTPFTPGTGNNNEGDIVSKHLDATNTNYLLRPTHAYITTTNGFFQTPPVCDFELNKTYHVAMTYDGAALKFYRNGLGRPRRPCGASRAALAPTF